ncbi:MAG: endolytic transglycosylase MltG [bacterium]|nr:endolytic transglycosylase MltG [bacterium]MDZ4247967.1 endolytic transglycosylase MltG [Patescibacteria group bacterium]
MPALDPERQADSPRARSRGRRFALVLTVTILLVVGTLHWYRTSLLPTGAAEAVVTIKQGATPDQIAQELKAKNLIRSERAFGLYVRLHGLAPDLNSGRFLVSGEKPADEVARTLTGRPNASDQFTIPEGFTQFAIGQRLERLGLTDGEEFRNLKAADFPEYDFLRELPEDATLEGYLFPETYSAPHAGTSARAVAKIMLNQFQEEIAPLRAKIAAGSRSLHELVTVASIAEEEVKTDRDRRLVAGIMYRRLEQGIRLDVDVTVRYALDKPSGALTAADLDTDDPYNTRRFKGLPPGPIANPGLAAIEAALDPEPSDYLFYLSAPDGTTYYAETNEGHERNKAEHL